MRETVIVRGGGDIATGTIYRLARAGFKVLVLEVSRPSCIRRKISFCECVYDGKIELEGMTGRHVENLVEAAKCWDAGEVPVIIDENGELIWQVKPRVLVDAILAKRNLGTTIDMAPLVIGLGPGFTAKKDVHVAIETMRGHDLGRVITDGSPLPDTGVPGLIKGEGKTRVMHAPATGVQRNICDIGDIVKKDQTLAMIDEKTPLLASLDGVLRGIIRDGYYVKKGLKVADIDPRIEEVKNCFTISDKARAIGGSVLEVIDNDLFG